MSQSLPRTKVLRLRQIDAHENAIPLWRRAVRRYRQLSQVYPFPVVWLYFINRAFYKALSLANAFIFQKLKPQQQKGASSSAPEQMAAIEHPSPPRQEKNIYAVKITGGLGDALIVARLVRDIQSELGHDLRFDIYYHSPKDIAPFFKVIKGFRESIHVDALPSTVAFYDFSLIANQFVVFIDEHFKPKALLKHHPKIVSMFGNVQSARKPIEKYIVTHPALDGAFADLAVRQGKKRHTFLHEMLGIPYGGDRLPLEVNRRLCATYGLTPGHFVTIHDGWDNKFKLVAHRPTKAIPLATIHNVVKNLKNAAPEFPVVQLGGKTGTPIDNVDLCLKDQLSFSESVSILSSSALHIDTESGLVHIAAALGIQSVVMFGPTNVEWFSYPQNINHAPKECGNCWWSTDSWMDICPIGKAPPTCTASIDALEVAQSAVQALKTCSRFAANGLKARRTQHKKRNVYEIHEASAAQRRI